MSLDQTGASPERRRRSRRITQARSIGADMPMDGRAERLTRVSTQVALAIAHAYGLQAIVDVVLDQTVKTMGARCAHVLLADERRHQLELAGQRSVPKEIVRQLQAVSFDAPLLAARAATTLQTQVRHVQDVDELT